VWKPDFKDGEFPEDGVDFGSGDFIVRAQVEGIWYTGRMPPTNETAYIPGTNTQLIITQLYRMSDNIDASLTPKPEAHHTRFRLMKCSQIPKIVCSNGPKYSHAAVGRRS
jgi:hypothetical protein